MKLASLPVRLFVFYLYKFVVLFKDLRTTRQKTFLNPWRENLWMRDPNPGCLVKAFKQERLLMQHKKVMKRLEGSRVISWQLLGRKLKQKKVLSSWLNKGRKIAEYLAFVGLIIGVVFSISYLADIPFQVVLKTMLLFSLFVILAALLVYALMPVLMRLFDYLESGHNKDDDGGWDDDGDNPLQSPPPDPSHGLKSPRTLVENIIRQSKEQFLKK